jgi:photosystem II stability/assembly factor-like uncharacterized protein
MLAQGGNYVDHPSNGMHECPTIDAPAGLGRQFVLGLRVEVSRESDQRRLTMTMNCTKISMMRRVFKTLSVVLLFVILAGTAQSQENQWVQTGYSGGYYDLVIDLQGRLIASVWSIARSTDEGSTWQSFTTSLPAGFLTYKLAMSPGGHFFVTGFYGGGYRSTDDGKTWTLISTGLLWTENFAFGNNGFTYAAVSNDGLYRTPDEGTTWAKVSEEMPTSVSVCSNGDVFLGTSANGLFRSTDNGDTWVSSSTGIPTKNVLAPTEIAAGTLLLGTFSNGIFRSTDGGLSWTPSNAGRQGEAGGVFRKGTSGEVYVLDDHSICRSTDNGMSWFEINRGLPAGLSGSFAVDPNGYLFAGTINNGLIRRQRVTTTAPPAPQLTSPSDGITGAPLTLDFLWQTSSGASLYNFQLALDPAFQQLVRDDKGLAATTVQVGGLLTSSTYYWRVSAANDEGTGPWSPTRTLRTPVVPPQPPAPLLPADGQTHIPVPVEIAWNSSFSASTYTMELAGDSSFTQPREFSDLTTRSISVADLGIETVYFWRVRAENSAGASEWSVPRRFVTLGRLLPWSYKYADVASSRLYQAVAFADSNIGVIVGNGGTIWRTSDGGLTWMQQESPTAKDLFAVCSINSLLMVAAGEGGLILRTTTGGSSWDSIASSASETILGMATAGGAVFAVGTDGLIMHSTDGGLEWVIDPSGVVITLRSISFADGQHGAVVGDSMTVLLTSDGGQTWRQVDVSLMSPFPSPSDLFGVSQPDAETIVAVGGEPLGEARPYGIIMRTTDAGATWQKETTETSEFLTRVLFLNKSVGVIGGDAEWAGPHGYAKLSFYWTDHGGAGWQNQEIGWSNGPDAMISGICRRGQNGLVAVGFVSIFNNFVVRSEGSLVSVEDRGPETAPQEAFLLPNYPNPFNPSTTISFGLPSSAFVTLKIFDLLGREVAKLVSEPLPAGNHSRQWNGAGVASGVYFYRLQAGSFTATKKLILLK